MYILAFSEFISSNNFSQLLKECTNLISSSSGLGLYQQGLPIRPAIDFVWGTNSGLRTYPIILFLTLLQVFFSWLWPFVYLSITFVVPFFGFLISQKMVKKITLLDILASLFYTGNVWIIQRIFTGFWQLNIAYAALPFLINIPLLVIKNDEISQLRYGFYITLFSLFTTIILIGQPHFLLMLLPFYFILTCLFIVKKQLIQVKKLILFALYSFLLIALINTYSIFPSIFFPEVLFTTPNQYFSLAAVTFNGMGATILNVLRMNPTPFPFVEHSWNITDYLQFVPIVFITIIAFINWKKTFLYFLPLCALVFLAKGTHEPGSIISKWMYQNIILLHYFRDPTRFIASIAFYGSFIISTFDFKKPISQNIKILITILACILFIFINKDTFSRYHLALFPIHIPSSYESLQHYLTTHNKQKIPLRYLSFPNITNMQYTWYTNPFLISSPNAFTMLNPLPLPSADSSYYPDTYSSEVSAYAYTQFLKSGNENFLLPLSANVFIADNSVANTGKSMEKFFSRYGYYPIFQDAPLSVFRAKNTPQLISTQKPVFALGNFQTLEKLHTITSRPVILLNQSNNSSNASVENVSDQEIYIDLSNPILALTSERLLPMYNLPLLKAGWDYDKEFVNYEPYKMQTIQTYGDLFTSGQSVISQNTAGTMSVLYHLDPGAYRVLMKVENQKSTNLIFQTSDKSFPVSIAENKNLSWSDEGKIVVKHPQVSLNIEKLDSNQLIIDALLLVPEKKYMAALNDSKKIISSMKEKTFQDIQEEKNTVHIIKYSIDSIQLKNPTQFLTYRFSFGKYWKSDVPSIAFISDGYAMTFVSKDKFIKSIYYPPNYYFHVFLIISIIATTGVITYICWYYLKMRPKN